MKIELQDCAFWRAGACSRCVDQCRYSTEKPAPLVTQSNTVLLQRGMFFTAGMVCGAAVMLFAATWYMPATITKSLRVEYMDSTDKSRNHPQGVLKSKKIHVDYKGRCNLTKEGLQCSYNINQEGY